MVHSPEFSFPRWIVVNLKQTFPIHLAPTWQHGSALSSLQTGSWKNSRKHPKLRRTSCSSSGRQKKFQFFCFCLSHGKFQYLVSSRFSPKSSGNLFLQNGDSEFQSVDCKSASQQGPSMILSTEMVGQNLKISLRFCIWNLCLRPSILAQVF